jgi:ferric-dicitrate binding protein FerR (iron transport regulator)
MLDNYHEPEELLSDPSFLAWYFNTEGDKGGVEQWMAAGPGRRDLVQQAVELLNTTRLPEKEVPAGQVDRAERTLMQKIAFLPDTAPAVLPLYKDRRWIAAACIIILLAAGLVLTRPGFLRPGQPEVKTAYGQISRQQLPDGTEVTMNANSRLSYSPGWKDGADREVWVNGEAFFHVTKTPLKSRFIVHTDHFDIIVTGTQFNVVNRHGKDNVLLQEGSIILHARDGKDLNMIPGDFAEFNGDRQLAKRPAKNDSILAWKEQKLVFDKTPLRELVTIINEQYGIRVRLAEDSIGDRTISAILPNNNLNVLLQALEATSEFDVVRQEEGIVIKAHSQQN